MSLTREEVDNIAHLARLAIREEDIPEYTRNLSSILDFVDRMNEADTEGVTPMAHPLDATQRLRPDEVTESDQRDHLMENAPLAEAGLFLVPKVIE
ncbi:MAG: Asp-tRNA(Asn)/Glu-tRNA(Gln) amidotransferase subunit GatC [Gammaproteobacteria bacterium]